MPEFAASGPATADTKTGSIHEMQYLLVGLALGLFFLTLVRYTTRDINWGNPAPVEPKVPA